MHAADSAVVSCTFEFAYTHWAIPVMQVRIQPEVVSVLISCQGVVLNIGWTPMHSTVTYFNSVVLMVSPLNWATPPVGASKLTMPEV